MLASLLDDDLGLLQAIEDFTIEHLIAQLAVEGLAAAILPRATGFNVERLCSEPCESAAHDLCSHPPNHYLTECVPGQNAGLQIQNHS